MKKELLFSSCYLFKKYIRELKELKSNEKYIIVSDYDNNTYDIDSIHDDKVTLSKRLEDINIEQNEKNSFWGINIKIIKIKK